MGESIQLLLTVEIWGLASAVSSGISASIMLPLSTPHISYHTIGSIPCSRSHALHFENGRLPKNPL